MRQVIALFCVLLLVGCISNESEITPSQFDRDFFRLTTNEQVRKFHEYDVETQYELVIVGNQIVHPPAIYLTEEFAKQGRAIVPFLRSRLMTAKREVTVRDIVAILAEMDRLRLYEVGNDASLMAVVEERTAAMRGQWKPVTQRMVEEIRNVPPG
jgi:hypothetical protein